MEIKTNKPLEQFSVKGVNVSISPNVDGNIKPENIKKDVSILGVVGTLESGGVLPPYIDPKSFTFEGISCTGYIGNQTLPEIIIPEYSTDGTLVKYVNSVKDQSGFKNYNGNIIMLNNITAIGRNAFSHCEGITGVVISNNTINIVNSAFSSCSSLTSITLPSSVELLGSFAFSNCSSLTNIIYNGTISQWNAIEKENFWIYNSPAQVVHCTDGDAPIN